MKKIFSLIQIVLILGCIMIHSSCSEDFLHKEPPAVLSFSTLQSAMGLEGVLVGSYQQLRGGTVFGSAMATDWVYASMASDDAYKGSDPGDQVNANLIERYEILPDHPYMNERWRECYNGISRANLALDILKELQAGPNAISAERAIQVEAEAKYLRAWFHFSANKVFKTIPYIMTSSEMGGKLPIEIPNTDAGWSYIESDLQFAIDNLPESWPAASVGRPTKYAAMTLKAQAYMYQHKLSDAKPLLDAVLNSGKYELVDYFDNYNEDTENNAESIFEIQCATSSTNHTSLMLTQAVYHQVGPYNLGWGFYQPSQSLVDAFLVDNDGLPYLDINTRPTMKNDMGIASSVEFTLSDQPIDMRLDWTVARRGVDFLGWAIHPGQAWIRAQSNGGPYMTKKYHVFFKNKDNQYSPGRYVNRNFRYHRLAHVILWRAEIAVEDGDLNMARELVNRIRERVKTSTPVMGKVTATTIPTSGVVDASLVDWTKPAGNYKTEPYPAGHVAFSNAENARNAVRMEIRLEFATEGQRFFDLRRWGIDVEVLNDFIQRDVKFRNAMIGAVYLEKNRYWPIPQTQIDLQMGVITQDPAHK